MTEYLKIRGARQHNLKNVNLDIPKNKLVVLTGVSGSGKSSMAFDTIYAEGQRRYVESLSTYARQFLGIMEKPDVDSIEGLSPSISIDQKTTSRNPRSTVGTITEIYDYLRLLYSRIGHPHCPICGREIARQTIDQIVDNVFNLINQNIKSAPFRFLILSPVVVGRKGEFTPLFENLKAKGFTSVRVDGHIKSLGEDFLLIKTNKHDVDVVCDKISIDKSAFKDQVSKSSFRQRLTESIETALKLSDGLVIISEIKDKVFELPESPKELTDHLYSEKFACPYDNIQIPEIEPRTFSFNSPQGACPTCSGLGKILKVDKDLIFSKEISITEGGILPFKNMFEHDTWYSRLLLEVCERKGINPKTPIKNLNQTQIDTLLFGTGEEDFKVSGKNRFGRITFIYEVFEGIITELEKRYKNSESDWVRMEIEKYMRERVCPDCLGARLKKEALMVTINELPINRVTAKSIDHAFDWINGLIKNDNNILTPRDILISKIILKEIATRLNFLLSVGLNYLSLDRASSTLSGGEAQRIRLASQIGSGLTGVLYTLDEPTIGLHQKDNQKLINTLKNLKGLGNTVIVVEHDEEMIKAADYIVDFGPLAGKYGGEVVATGTTSEICNNPNSITGSYLSKRKIIHPKIINQQMLNGSFLKIGGIRQNNLKSLDISFPLGKLIAVTGVSGSGKSSLLIETVYPAVKNAVNPLYKIDEGAYDNAEGIENINKVIMIDQSPIGRTPRSNPATYIKLFDDIREVFALTRDAKSFGFKKSRFSFNLKGGRCEVCEGQGQIKIEMQFMSDIWITCEVCNGKRYNNQTLEVIYKGKNISEVLDMNVTEAKEFFHTHPKIVSKLDTLEEVGLGYIELGQPATTLSGGEAQRVKLASELSKRDTGNTLYMLDEPTTGLHFYDLEKLITVLRKLVAKGNTVIVIEHNLDVIKNSDWIIDLGPEGGDKGGYLVFEGSPQEIRKAKNSYTGQFLNKAFKN
jgi:excinuclease ABC subunit A